jgi:hypothetical protein
MLTRTTLSTRKRFIVTNQLILQAFHKHNNKKNTRKTCYFTKIIHFASLESLSQTRDSTFESPYNCESFDILSFKKSITR